MDVHDREEQNYPEEEDDESDEGRTRKELMGGMMTSLSRWWR